MDALDRNGVDVSELMQHEAEKFEQNGMQYDDDLLLEEVICNNAANIMQDAGRDMSFRQKCREDESKGKHFGSKQRYNDKSGCRGL